MTDNRTQLENEDLRRRLQEAEDTILAIRSGAVDAFVVEEAEGHRVYTLEGADRPYRILVEQMQQGALTLSSDGTIAYCNLRFSDLVGVPHGQLFGVAFRDFIPADELTLYDSLLQQGMVGAGAGETILQCSDGSLLPVFLTFNMLPPDSGVAIGLLVTDLTAQRHQEKLNDTLELLRESEERRRLALDAAELGAWNIDPETNTLVSDERFQVIFTGEPGPITYEQAFAALHPDDRERVRDAVAAATRPDNPESYVAQYRVVHPDGSVRWVYAKGRAHFEPYQSGQKLKSFDGTVADVTEHVRAEELLRESESRFRQLADTIPQLAWTATPDGHIDWYNNRWFEYTGTTLEQMQGWGWQSVHDPEVLPEVLDRWKASLASGEPFDMAFPLRGADGVYRTFLTKVLPFCNAQGRIIRWFGTNTDISEQQQLQDELRRVAAQLSEADRRKDEFLATLAHELRNPLSPIKSATQLMQVADGDVSQYQELSEIIDRQVHQMVRLVDDLLDVSRISRGKITLKSAPCDLSEVIARAVESVKPLIEKSGHQLHVEKSDQPLIVFGDMARLSQVLVNLLNNAAKYTPDKGEIWLSVTADNELASLQVRDSGRGIAASELSKVFEMFVQLDAEPQHGQSGLGIGLSLVKSLVSLHGGEVFVESEGIGRGSQFTVRLPLMKQDQSVANVTDKTTETRMPTRAFRVLVVEDTRANRYLLGRLLRVLGHEVEEAADGIEGLEKALSYKPEIIISDISMPRMNGFEMASKLRQTDSEVHMIALTGYGQQADRLNANDCGFDDYLVKPVDVAALDRLFSRLSNLKAMT